MIKWTQAELSMSQHNEEQEWDIHVNSGVKLFFGTIEAALSFLVSKNTEFKSDALTVSLAAYMKGKWCFPNEFSVIYW